MAVRSDVGAYFSVHEYGKTTAKKVYIFGWWGCRPLLLRPLIQRLTSQGYACVLFIPKRHLIAIGTPYSEIVAATELITEEVLHRIQIDKMIGVRMFASFGISFGTIFAMAVAKRSWDIRRLVLVAPFGDFERHVQLWPRHWYFSRVLASQPTGREASGRVLSSVGAAQNIDLLKGKQVLVCYAKKDRIIHSEATEAMVRMLNSHGIDTDVSLVPGGHLRGIIQHLIFKRTYAKLLPAPKVKG